MTTTLAEPITVPGVYDVPSDLYHADPVPGGSLSASGAKDLLPPSCPAKYRYKRDHEPPPKRVFELGHAAHKKVLGTGPELVLVDRARWDTDKVRAELAAIRAAGGIPLKRAEWDMVHAMAEALLAHPEAAALFAPGSGRPEQSLFWVDPDTDVWRRARLDWLPYPHGRRLVIPDYKTCVSAAPDDLPRVIHDRAYHRAGAWYVDGVLALGLADEAVFVLVFQEKTPPYLVHLVSLERRTLLQARAENAQALALFAECQAAGVWPGYGGPDPTVVALPPWAEARFDREVW